MSGRLKSRCRTCVFFSPLAPVLLVFISGCQAPEQRGRKWARWDDARLSATLQVADENIAAGRFDRARRTLSGFQRVPDLRLQLTLARVDVEEGRYADALERLEPMAEDGAEDATYHHLTGVAREGLGRSAEAATAYATAYRSRPDAHVLVAWADALVQAGQEDEAIAVVRREMPQYPGDVGVHALAARLFERRAAWPDAVREWETAALAQPKSREIKRQLAEACSAAGMHDRATPEWRELVDSADDATGRSRYQRRLAAACLAAGQFEAARREYAILALRDPEDGAAQLGLAAACAATDKPAEALAAAMRVISNQPHHRDALLLAAMSCHRLNEMERAKQLLAAVPAAADRGGWRGNYTSAGSERDNRRRRSPGDWTTSLVVERALNVGGTMTQSVTHQRQFERRTLDVRLDVLIDEPSRKQVSPLTGLTVPGRLSNASRGGAFVIVATYLPRGTQVVLEIPAGGELLEGRVAARVMNVKMVDREPRYGLGLRFEEPDSEYVRMLASEANREAG